MVTKVIKISLWFLLLFLILSEIILKSIGYHYCPLRLEGLTKQVDGLGKTDFRTFHSLQDQFFEYDSNLIWRPKPSFKIFNVQGLRGEVITLGKDEKEYRIFTIGDSNTLGPQDNLGWPEYLGQLVKEKYPHAKVINAGVWGYSSWQILKRFEEILQYKPDMVLISVSSNDAHRVTISDKDYIRSKRFFEFAIASRICQLFLTLSDKIILGFRKDKLLIPRVSLQEYESNINRITMVSKEKNIKIILLTRPFIGESHHPLYWKNFGPQYNEFTKSIAEQRGIPLIDIFLYFKGKKEYFVDECHFNDSGYRVAAELIYNTIMNEVH